MKPESKIIDDFYWNINNYKSGINTKVYEEAYDEGYTDGEKTVESSILVWKVEEGPFEASYYPLSDHGWDESNVWLLALATTPSDKKEPFYEELWFESFNEAYEFMQCVNSSIEPITVKGT